MDYRDRSHSLAARVLGLLNKSGPKGDLIRQIVRLVQAELGAESIGIRLNDGEDYPYYFTRGFSKDFVEKENHLCARSPDGQILRDQSGNPYLECMCGNVIRGRTDPALPFFTEQGSFWTNSTTNLLASTTEADRQARTRNRCNGEGYESVALIPIRCDDTTYGLLQVNDRRPDRFHREMIELLEGLGSSIGLLFSLKLKEDELTRHRKHIEKIVGARTRELDETARFLREEIEQRRNSDDSQGVALIDRLQSVLDEIKILKGVLPICCVCKKIRDDEGYWQQLEGYIQDHSSAEFTHGICPECVKETYGEVFNA